MPNSPILDAAIRANCQAQFPDETSAPECLYPECKNASRDDSACPFLHLGTKAAISAAFPAELAEGVIEAMAQANYEDMGEDWETIPASEKIMACRNQSAAYRALRALIVGEGE